MKPGAVFISIGRGAVVDEAALYEALSSGHLAGAACDVFATEPLPADSPLWTCDNLLLTAHNADYTEDYFELAVRTWRENLQCFLRGDPLATPRSMSRAATETAWVVASARLLIDANARSSGRVFVSLCLNSISKNESKKVWTGQATPVRSQQSPPAATAPARSPAWRLGMAHGTAAGEPAP